MKKAAVNNLDQIIKRPGLLIGLLVLLLSAVFSVSCGSNIILGSPDQDPGSPSDDQMTEAEPDSGQNSGDDVGQTSSGDSISVEDDSLFSDGESVVSREPEIGEIVFALDITESYEPIDPSFVFTEGITEIHAIFEYSGMSPDYTWERVWYLNDQEISRSASPWTDTASGIFDYSVDNDGDPLPPGDWILELYVDGELCSLGVFIIEEE